MFKWVCWRCIGYEEVLDFLNNHDLSIDEVHIVYGYINTNGSTVYLIFYKKEV